MNFKPGDLLVVKLSEVYYGKAPDGFVRLKAIGDSEFNSRIYNNDLVLLIDLGGKRDLENEIVQIYKILYKNKMFIVNCTWAFNLVKLE